MTGNREIKLKDIFVYILFLVIVVVATMIDSRFFTLNNFLVIARQTAPQVMIAYGMCLVITAGQIDLSIGGIVCLSGMVTALALEKGMGLAVSSLLGLLIGVAFGLVNGLLIAKLNLPAFLVTLGTSSVSQGIALTMTNQKPITIYDTTYKNFWGLGNFLGIPTILLWAILFFIISLVLYKYIPFGNHVKATGGNLTAAKFSGIKTDAVIIKTMLFCGICASVCGLMTTTRLNQGRPDIGTTLGLDAITAVALGGTPFTGGSGSIATSVIGTFVLITLTNALVIFGVPTTAQNIVKGVIVIVAVTISTRNVSIKLKKKA